MRTALSFLLLVFLCLAACSAGSIEGKIEPPARVKAVWAIHRPPREIFTVENTRFPGRFDPKTGNYTVPDLAPGTYDLEIETDAGPIEGVDLRLRKEKPPLYDLNLTTRNLTLTGLDLKRDLGEEDFASDEEKNEAIRAFFRIGSLLELFDGLLKVDQFMDKVRGLYVHGDAEQASFLVMLARFASFHSEAGDEVIWRLEVWPMRWYYGNWAKSRYSVLYRLRLSAAEYRAMARFFDPKLGGIDVADGAAARVNYAIPEKLDRSMGKPAGEEL